MKNMFKISCVILFASFIIIYLQGCTKSKDSTTPTGTLKPISTFTINVDGKQYTLTNISGSTTTGAYYFTGMYSSDTLVKEINVTLANDTVGSYIIASVPTTYAYYYTGPNTSSLIKYESASPASGTIKITGSVNGMISGTFTFVAYNNSQVPISHNINGAFTNVPCTP